MPNNTKQGDLVLLITEILVNNGAKITPETTWVHDIRELINSQVLEAITKIKSGGRFIFNDVEVVNVQHIEQVEKEYRNE